MNELPLVEEIREARRLSTDATDATLQLIRLEAALTSASLLQRQLAIHADLEAELPGEKILEEVAERWDALADLHSAGPRPGDPFSVRLRMRITQFESARQFLVPLRKDAQVHANHLHQLQHHQREALEDPQYSEVVTELAIIGAERQDVSERLLPMQQRLALVEPAQNLLDTFVERIDEYIVDVSGGDPNGLLAWRAASLARTLVQALDDVLTELQLEIPIPRPLVVPDAPHPASSEPLMIEVRRIADNLQDLRTAVRAEGKALHAEHDVLKKRFDELTQAVVDRMG